MAEASRYSNVIVATADGQTISGQFRVIGIKASNGSNASNVMTLKNGGGNVLWTSSSLAANTVSALDQFDEGLMLRNDTYTVGMSQSGGSLFIYIE